MISHVSEVVRLSLEKKLLDRYPLCIREGALETANIYARLAVCEEERVEVFMHMVGNDVIEDIYPTLQQLVGPGSCTTVGDGKAQVYSWMQREKTRQIGWCHSHAEYNTFFSSIDVETIKKMLSEGPTRTIDGEDVQYLYGLVVNAANDAPYGVLAYRKADEEKAHVVQDIPVHIVPGGCAIDEGVARGILDDALFHVSSHSSDSEFPPVQAIPPEVRSQGTAPLPDVVRDDPLLPYHAQVEAERNRLLASPKLYGDHFAQVIDMIGGQGPRLWIHRAIGVLHLYENKKTTQAEREAIKRILNASTYLRRRHNELFGFLQSYLTHAASTTDPPLGERRTEDT